MRFGSKLAKVTLFLAVLAGCAQRDTFREAPDQLAFSGARETIFVRTDREFDGSSTVFGPERSSTPSHARFDISIPPNHQKGQIETRRGQVDPNREFTVLDAVTQSETAFLRDLNSRLSKLPPDQREVTVFVHGYNTNYIEAIYRHAQIMHDFAFDGVAVTYSWSSAANALGYVYDRDSAEFAASDLVRLIQLLQKSRGYSVQIIAHSMGSFLTMQALHQIALTKGSPGWGKLDGVFMISPDIDVDLFVRKAEEMGSLPPSFVIFTSSQDRALALSGGITGTGDRLGSVADVSRLSDLKVTVVNLSGVVDGDPLRHTKAATSAETIDTINSLRDLSKSLSSDEIARRGFVPGTVLVIRNATEVIVDP